MKYIPILSLIVVMGFCLLPSCSAVKWAVPAGAGTDMDDESWASRYIPGVRAISNLVPPPTEARMQWDERYKKHEHWGSPTDIYP